MLQREYMNKQIIEEISAFKREFDPMLIDVFEHEISEAAQVSNELGWMLSTMKTFALSGGKRLRPFLFTESVLGLSEVYGVSYSRKDVMRLAVFLELIHLELLVLDDIMDKSPTRHGVETVHIQEQKKFAYEFGERDAEHFGISAGIISGIIFGNVAMKVAARLSSSFNSEHLLRVIQYYNDVVIKTAYGQFHDMYAASKDMVPEERVHMIHVYKTAKYTIEGPLVAGALLHDPKIDTQKISSFAEPLGVAFQIVDDLIGTFGTDEHIGKSVMSDFEEGKHTFLTVKAHELLSEADSKEFSALLAKSAPTRDDFEAFRSFIEASGSKAYSEELAAQYLEESLQNLAQSAYNESVKERLRSLAQFIVHRDY